MFHSNLRYFFALERPFAWKRGSIKMPRLQQLKYVEISFCAPNFQIVAVSRPCIRLFSFRYRFKALTEWSLISVVSRSKLLWILNPKGQKNSNFSKWQLHSQNLRYDTLVIDGYELRRILLGVRAENPKLAKSLHAIEMYQHENSHTTCYTCRLPKKKTLILSD